MDILIEKKQEQYLKDDDAMEVYLTSVALDGAELRVNPEAPAVSGLALEVLINQYREFCVLQERLKRRYPSLLLEQLLKLPTLSPAELSSTQSVTDWGQRLQASLNLAADPSQRFLVQTVDDPEHQRFFPQVELMAHGVPYSYPLSYDFFSSSEYRQVDALARALEGLIEPGAVIKRGERQLKVDTFKQAFDWLMQESKRGLGIQRYKGLGEMNPDQLWETTMDPESRRMLRVTIDDAIGADQMFTTLMGDAVEPRREFIEKNALLVSNLDV